MMQKYLIGLCVAAMLLGGCDDDATPGGGFGLDSSLPDTSDAQSVEDTAHPSDISTTQDTSDTTMASDAPAPPEDAAVDAAPGADAADIGPDGDGPPPAWARCSTPAECVLAFNTCCGVCSVPSLDDYDAVNEDGIDAHRDDVCPGPPGPCPDCVQRQNRWLVATCQAQTCEGVDLRQSDVTSCTDNDDCRLRTRECCQCGADTDPSNLIAVSDNNGYMQLACNPNLACPECAPDYPSDIHAVCGDDGHCRVE